MADSWESVTFEATIGVEVKGEMWACVEIPHSAELFGTRKSVRVDAQIDEVQLLNVGAMVTGQGGHMLSLNAQVRKRLGKGIGDTVNVHVSPVDAELGG